MALNRTINVMGQLEIKEGLLMNVNFNYVGDTPPTSAHFDYTEDGVSVNGDYNVTEQKFDHYSVFGGIASDETLEAADTVLARIKTEFKTI
jgi:hypothetical protein